MPNNANGAFGSELFNQSIPIGGTQSNTDERSLPTPKNTEKSLSSGIPVSEHDKMMRTINEGATNPPAPPIPVDHVVVHWKDMPRKADQALFLAQQGKPVNQIARLTGWSEGSVKTTFSTWKKKKLVTGRAAKIEPQLHEDRMADFRVLFLERGMNKSQIVEQYDYHPNVVEDAFYRLKRERLLSGSSGHPIIVGAAPTKEKPPEEFPKPPEPMTIGKARAIIVDCFLEKGMKRDGIAHKFPEVEPFINKVFQELIADGELLGSPGKPILKTKIPDPVYRLPTEPTAPPLREKDVVKPEKPKLSVEPPSTHQAPPSSTKLNNGYVEPKPLPERDPLPPQVKQWVSEVEQAMGRRAESDNVGSFQPNTDVSFKGPHGTVVLVDSENEIDPTSEEAKRAAIETLAVGVDFASEPDVSTGMTDSMKHSIDVLLGKKPVAHLTPGADTTSPSPAENYDTMEDPDGVWDNTVREIREQQDEQNDTKKATDELVADSWKDNPYVQTLQRELREAKQNSYKLARTFQQLVPWEHDPKTKELREELAELKEKSDSVASTPPPPFKNGMTNEGPTLIIPADTNLEFEDDGTFRHLTLMTECEEPPDVAPDPVEVGRLQLNNEELSVEALRERFDVLIQSLTLCGAERFDIDLSLKGWKP